MISVTVKILGLVCDYFRKKVRVIIRDSVAGTFFYGWKMIL